MVAKGTPLPRRIEPDAIVEALVELRFDVVSPLPEILFGRLAELRPWTGFVQRNLPAYQVPAAFRESDVNLRFVPIFELAGSNPSRAVRIGAHVLSYHRYPPYPGWPEFSAEFDVAIDALFDKAEGLVVRRIGLRYINALTTAGHGIASVSDLDMSVLVSGELISGNLNLTFTRDIADRTQCRVSVATREYVQGQIPVDAALVADVDVFTTEGFGTDSKGEVKRWVGDAHMHKNQAFFGLLTPNSMVRLRRDT
jgi:uncharacterized protein (TIGR04255 family)